MCFLNGSYFWHRASLLLWFACPIKSKVPDWYFFGAFGRWYWEGEVLCWGQSSSQKRWRYLKMTNSIHLWYWLPYKHTSCLAVYWHYWPFSHRLHQITNEFPYGSSSQWLWERTPCIPPHPCWGLAKSCSHVAMAFLWFFWMTNWWCLKRLFKKSLFFPLTLVSWRSEYMMCK